MIYNRREYKTYIRSLFADADSEEVEKYIQELKDSDKKRKTLQKQINDAVKKLHSEQDEKVLAELGRQIDAMRSEKTAIVPSGELAITRFATLSDGAKKFACTEALLNKYLTYEMVKNNPLKFPTNENGDIVIDFDRLKESHLHELAVDIRDFVHNYMENDGDKVTYANYFLDLYKSTPTIYDLDKSIDRYYDKARENMNDYTASRKGIEIVENYPQQKMVLVRMMTPEALDFESNCMGHCIRRDRYVEKINTTAEYYSLRSMEKGKPLYPCVTMYFDEGKLAEVVGKSNHAISGMNRIAIIRNYLKKRFNLKDDAELMTTDKIPYIDERRLTVSKRNLGFIPDKDGRFYDLYNLPKDQKIEFSNCPITAHNLDYINKESIAADTLWLQGNYTPHLIDKLNRFERINQLVVAVKFNFDGLQTLDLSQLKGVKKLGMSSVNLRKINRIIFPEDVEKVEMWSVDFSNVPELDFSACKKLKTLELRNSDLRKTSAIKLPLSIENIDCSFVKASPKNTIRLSRLQKILNYKRKIHNFLSLKGVINPLKDKLNKWYDGRL